MARRFYHALAVLCVACCSAAEPTVIDAFSYPSQAAAEKAWRPSPISPRVALDPQSGGVTFPCPFARDLPRVYWDRAVSLDLSRFTSLQMDVSCNNPQAFRSFNLYLKSGNGWYVWTAPLPASGRQRLLALKGDFSTEGKPAGWDRIELVRLSAWKGVPEDTAVTLFSLATGADPILLVRNTVSTPSAAEKSFAAAVNERLSRWLRDMNIPHGVVTDEDVIRGALVPPGAGLQGARVALLGYNPHPPADELAALRRFVASGGKLIVCYGADPGLADLMRVRLASYRKNDPPGQWNAFAFTDPAGWRVPARIFQESFNILPAFPADDTARVIAWWENAAGERSADPAWIASDAGLWMTHVLLDDDAQNKQQLLLGLLGRYEPSVWPAAARTCLDRAGKIDSFRGVAEAVAALRRQLKSAADPDRVKALLDQADALNRGLAASHTQGDYLAVIRQSRELRAALTEAYGRVQRPKAGEFRGVWEHDGIGWYPGDWDRTCAFLADHGINAVFANLQWGALAHYPSRVLPQSTTFRRFGDQAAQCCEAAHRHGLQVHAWKVCWSLSGAPADYVARVRKQGRVQVTAGGKTTSFLCPSHPQNRAQELSAIREIAATYPLDGIHLDYVRFASPEYCYCSSCRAAFEQWTGERVARWPRDVANGGALRARYRAWRAARITDFVRAAAAQARAARPGIRVSAAVWGNYPDCANSVGQDWAVWLKEGLVDFVCPMNYTTDRTRFATLTHAQLGLPNAKGRIYPGLGVTADESQLRADQVIEQVAALRDLAAPGFMLFDLSYTLREETLPALKWGLTADAEAGERRTSNVERPTPK